MSFALLLLLFCCSVAVVIVAYFWDFGHESLEGGKNRCNAAVALQCNQKFHKMNWLLVPVNYTTNGNSDGDGDVYGYAGTDDDDGDDDDENDDYGWNGNGEQTQPFRICICMCEMFGKWAQMTPETKPKGHKHK